MDLMRAKFLWKAAELMQNQNISEMASYFAKDATERMLKKVDNKLQSTSENIKEQRRGNKNFDIDHAIEFSHLICQFCGHFKNPLITKVRLKPKGRRQIGNMRGSSKKGVIDVSIQKDTLADKTQPNDCKKNRKSKKKSSKGPILTSKCEACNCESTLRIQQPECIDTKKKLQNPKGSSTPNTAYLSSRTVERLKKSKDNDKSSPESLSKSARRKSHAKNSPLAKLLLEKKTQTATSPSIRSFLFNT